MNHYTDTWQTAKERALANGKTIVEHGWEQHVVIDEEHGLVYRYPRHETAAAKLQDETQTLSRLRREITWPVAIPDLLDYDGERATYKLIAGDVLDESKLARLSKSQFANIGRGLGQFLAVLHGCNKELITREAWKQPGSLLDYYKNRIEFAEPSNPWRASALSALERLVQAQKYTTEVVVHGDLHGLNIVVSPDGEQLVGIIDFSEIEYGDPHQDFRKLFMTDEQLLEPALDEYQRTGKGALSADLVRDWAYVNEWSNVCFYADQPTNLTYQRALAHLKRWHQLVV